MNCQYWLSLIFSIALVSLGGRLFAFVHKQIPKEMVTYADVHPFLRGEKMPINQAQISDIATIDGISLTKAQAIYDLYQKEPQASLDAVLELKGVGPKTLEKISAKFYSAYHNDMRRIKADQTLQKVQP